MWSFEKAELETLDHILFVFLPLKFKLCWLVCWFLDRLRTRRTLLAKSVSSCTSPSLLGTSSGSCPGWMWSCRYVHQGSQTNFYRTKFHRHFYTDIFLPRHFPTRGKFFISGRGFFCMISPSVNHLMLVNGVFGLPRLSVLHEFFNIKFDFCQLKIPWTKVDPVWFTGIFI